MGESLRVRARYVGALGSALSNSGHGLDAVPSLLKQILEEPMWRDFVTPRGELVHHDDFETFVTTPPLKGLGATVDLVQRVVADDPEAVQLLREALKRKPGPSSSDHNMMETIQQGTSRAYALDRLERDAPDLHTEVLAGNLSAHAAMVRAGFRPKTFTIRSDRPESIAAALRQHLTDEQLAELRRLLE